MTSKVLSFLFLFCASIGVFAAELYSEDNREYETNYIWSVTWDGSNWNEDFGIETFQQVIEYRVDRSETNPKLYRKIVSGEMSGGPEVMIPWQAISRLTIDIRLAENVSCPNKTFDLSELKFFEGCPLDSIRILELDYSKYPCFLDLELSKWSNFKGIQNAKSIRHFKMNGQQAPEFNIEALYNMPLEILELTKHFGKELNEFPNLKQLSMPGVREAFTHQILNFEDLNIIHDNDGIYYNRYNKQHAERYYVLRATNALHHPIHAPIFLEGRYLSPLEKALGYTKNNLPVKWTEKGDILVYENELPQFTHFKGENDTLFYGQIKRGKPRGIWSFKIEEQFDYGDHELFHLNTKAKPLELPQNGFWELNYVNGLTAITGQFENGFKIGEWKFYNEAGILRSKKTFDRDTLKHSVVYFEMDGVTCQSRTYFFDENSCLQSFNNADKAYFNYFDLYYSEKDKLVIEDGSISIKHPDSNRYQTIRKGSDQYYRAMRDHVIDLLYPEYSLQEFPYEY